MFTLPCPSLSCCGEVFNYYSKGMSFLFNTMTSPPAPEESAERGCLSKLKVQKELSSLPWHLRTTLRLCAGVHFWNQWISGCDRHTFGVSRKACSLCLEPLPGVTWALGWDSLSPNLDLSPLQLSWGSYHSGDQNWGLWSLCRDSVCHIGLKERFILMSSLSFLAGCISAMKLCLWFK